VIAVPDLERTAAYDQDVLEFTIHPMGDPGWRFYKKDAYTIHIGHCPDALAPDALGDHSYFAYIMAGCSIMATIATRPESHHNSGARGLCVDHNASPVKGRYADCCLAICTRGATPVCCNGWDEIGPR
jgi:hypothetical protein